MSGSLALLVPAWNASRWLPRLLASAAAQGEPFDEIIVYDDASTDDTAVVAKRLGASVVHGHGNKGCSAGKNVLAATTDCDWIHFHDADDELMPNFTGLAHRWMADGRADVVLFPYEERDDADGRVLGVRRFDPEALARDPRAFAIAHQINPFCGLYRREAFLAAGGYDEDPRVLYNEDVAMHLGLAFAGLAFAAETEVSIINHRRGGSMSSANAARCAMAQYEVLRKTAERPGGRAYAPLIAARLWAVAGVLAAHLDWPSAEAASALALALAPGAVEGSPGFRAMARVSAPLALRTRERLIRAFRPRFRADYPAKPPR